MLDQNLTLQFSSSIKDITDINESFGSGVVRICYTGKNRNGSSISRKTIERAIPTLYNCPIVCNYNVEEDTIGGHDIDVITNRNGELCMIPLTSAIGVVPQSAQVFWETVNENGIDREYVSTEVILWKRSPAYSKIVNDGITSQSMEITVKEGALKDGVFNIDDFVFTALCLLGEGIEPCFESASLTAFSKNNLIDEFAEIMSGIKEACALFASNKLAGKTNTEGGELKMELNEVIEPVVEPTEPADTIELEVEELEVVEVEKPVEEVVEDPVEEPAQEEPVVEDGDPNPEPEQGFALASHVFDELMQSLESEKVQTAYGEMPRYVYVDRDEAACEIYAYDTTDRWNLYGFAYEQNGDILEVKFESRQRKKFAIVDFNEGSQGEHIAVIFDEIESAFGANRDAMTEQFNASMAALESELGELRQFKADTIAAEEKAAREAVFAQFESKLSGVEAFEALREECAKYSVEELEEKCFAICGRTQNFSYVAPQQAPKIAVDRSDKMDAAPYGGIFEKYGITK